LKLEFTKTRNTHGRLQKNLKIKINLKFCVESVQRSSLYQSKDTEVRLILLFEEVSCSDWARYQLRTTKMKRWKKKVKFAVFEVLNFHAGVIYPRSD
jgi:hypothetical protein